MIDVRKLKDRALNERRYVLRRLEEPRGSNTVMVIKTKVCPHVACDDDAIISQVPGRIQRCCGWRRDGNVMMSEQGSSEA